MPPLALGDADEREPPAARLPRLYIAIEASTGATLVLGGKRKWGAIPAMAQFAAGGSPTDVRAVARALRCDPRYAGLPAELIPATESLGDVDDRLAPYWTDVLVPELAAGLGVFVEVYEDLEPGKSVDDTSWAGRGDAEREIEFSRRRLAEHAESRGEPAT